MSLQCASEYGCDRDSAFFLRCSPLRRDTGQISQRNNTDVWLLPWGEAILLPSLSCTALGPSTAPAFVPCSPEVERFMYEFWHIIVYFANTLIFIVVGIQTRWALDTWSDFTGGLGKVAMLYIALNLSRSDLRWA